MNNQMFSGSICITDIMEKLKAGHSAFSKSPKNGKVYCNILTWLNEEQDEFGNIMSHQLSSTKDMKEKEEKFYIGNSRRIKVEPISKKDIPDDSWSSNVPVREKTNSSPSTDDDLPF